MIMTLCDYPGCNEPATTIALGKGANTAPKEWYGCGEHKAKSANADDVAAL